MIATPILHQYPKSPFAEKVRLILSYKALPWTAVTAQNVMPKPNLQALTGGYRRIPVLQIGADLYCDTALIVEVLEKLAPTPTLFPPEVEGIARVVAQWADAQLFATAMAYNFQPSALPHIFPGQSAEQIKAFADDRAQMRAGAPRMPAADAAAAYREYLRRIATTVARQSFVLGSVPCIADFSCYHPLWFTGDVAGLASIFDATPALKAWLQRMAALRRPAADEVSDEQAIAVAANATPAPLPDDPPVIDHEVRLGTEVIIKAESFGLEETAGVLVAASASRYTIRRTDSRAGTVHVHFPRIGFLLRAAAGA
jgi:glutathione S-transferase